VEPDKARHALRQTIWYLRQLLGQSIITTQADTLTLATWIRVDRDAFLAAIESGDLTAATTIYRGTFLDGFAAPGGVEFEHWADLERERLRQTFLRAAESVIRGWLNEGQVREALELARRAQIAAPEQERAWRLLFETMVQSGDRLALTLEAARWLVLWMAFDDVVRVAALKLRASRAARVKREVAAREDEIVKVFDHFKPGAPEIAGLLPAGAARRLLAWDEAHRARGRDPWALPMKIGTHTVLGALALRFVAGLKGQRRRGSRFALEQSLIERWLAAVVYGAREHWPLGHEIAQCGRLIKGYGSTNERGKLNLLHVIDHLATPAAMPDPAARARAIAAARVAAQADDAGRGLDQALLAHGAPPRPLRAQPIRWYRRRPDMPATGVTRPS